ncbi:MAG: glutathione S-transferase family protein [Hyphomicrobiales bacterium]|nr:glutathione S-transferase family protein [Hyphomicrobiales bacterium]
MALHLVIGNKTYSSWSFRPWLAMKVAGISFAETLIPLNSPDFKKRVLAVSGAGKVPVLIDGETHIWDSLAILEYLAEKFPDAGLWPREPAARANARAIAAEMHAGFQSLRQQLPMNFQRPIIPRKIDAEVAADVARIEAIWSDCHARYGKGGPFLYGSFGAADAMYAPVVSRFHTYAIEVGTATRDYMSAHMRLPAWKEWDEGARREPWVLPHDEVDYPDVPRELSEAAR